MTIRRLLKNRYMKLLPLAWADAGILCLSFIFSAYLSGYSLSSLGTEWFLILPSITIVQLAVFLRFGLYRAVLRYASIDSVITIIKAVTVSCIVFVLGLYLVQKQLSVKFLLLNLLLTTGFIGGSRFFIRYYFELKRKFQTGRRVLIYGAGDMGSLALSQLFLNKDVLYSPVGFIDDDIKKIGLVIRGVKVLGTLKDLENILEQFRIEEVVVAIAEIDGDHVNAVVKRCKEKGIVCRIIPCFSRLLEIEPGIRNVELADLMRRTSRDLDRHAISEYLCQKTILITGAAGSIGSEIVRQCLSYDPKTVIALDQSECGLYSLSEELGEKAVKYVLCDTTNFSSLERVFDDASPNIVFHAAAYKHVPLLENNLMEAVRNNVSSTKYLCDLSDSHGVNSFVMISTDKAVRPSSVMGATKRICELIVQNYDKESSTEFVSVRFGNVLGSSGSVVPKFVDQIRRGGPVTVTHPEATRFFMLIDEAVQLVLQAATIGNGGEIFILDMGNPVKIVDMAEDLIYLMGRRPYKDIDIEFCGLRIGEKIHEELFNDETEEPTRFKEISIGKSRVVDWELLSESVNKLLLYADSNKPERVLGIMRDLIPEGDFLNGFQCDSKDVEQRNQGHIDKADFEVQIGRQ